MPRVYGRHSINTQLFPFRFVFLISPFFLLTSCILTATPVTVTIQSMFTKYRALC